MSWRKYRNFRARDPYWYIDNNSGYTADITKRGVQPVGFDRDGTFIPFACQGQRKRTGRTMRHWRNK